MDNRLWSEVPKPLDTTKWVNLGAGIALRAKFNPNDMPKGMAGRRA